MLEEKKPTVLVLLNGRPLLLDWYDEHMDRHLEGWALGSEAGAALADLLVGDEVPSGKLTMTFPAIPGRSPLLQRAAHRPPLCGGQRRTLPVQIS